MNRPKLKTLALLLIIPCSLVVGFLFHALVYSDFRPSCNWKTFSYTNPELGCINTDEVFSRIHKEEVIVQEYIASAVASKKVSRVGVFFRDLETRRWFGVHQADNFSPGSLLKLPIAVAFYKLAEIDRSILSQTLEYKPSGTSLNNLEFFEKAEPLVSGKGYSVADLIERMIKDSDNEVLPTLMGALNEGYYNKVLLDLGIRVPLQSEGGIHADFFSPASYAAILRSLYNASYLNVEGSGRLLEIMSRSSFDKGLTAGLPEGTLVAHKFGEGTAVDPVTRQVIKLELHDCGIVYKKAAPYILCVMTEGARFEDLAAVIAGISKIVWSD